MEIALDLANDSAKTSIIVQSPFGAKICLITSLRDTCYIEILPKDRNPTQELWLSFWSEVHYNSLYATADACFHKKSQKEPLAFLDCN
ncbi:OVARIAN TUMOR DOMAIN-containing deubiquitinating enzyme 11-like [Rosa rugosa]|uniref:OVARIAN TUMOR DOMAIN-containing deubiquitinating enzyme 11-like n=1 Tax=Rosa rugosa TaxID=74645 RepID=UPI002B4120F4|nr:OVARIAN TUMOR DOMAIN-containing deubiquitinating enzyme 11-like [Rosa rugosa]